MNKTKIPLERAMSSLITESSPNTPDTYPDEPRFRTRHSAFIVYANFAISEFNNLRRLSSCTADIERGDLLKAAIVRKLARLKRSRVPVWEDPTDSYEEVFELDRLNLRLMDMPQLRLRAFALLERYKTLFSLEEFERITRVVRGVGNEGAVSDDDFRAQTDEVLASMHWYLLFSRARDRKIYELMKLAIGLLSLLALIAISCTAAKMVLQNSVWAQLASFCVFLLMGGLGAATSVTWRLQGLLCAPPSLPETHLTDLGGLKYGTQGVVASIGCGVVFAFILYMLFAGSILSGSFFPQISTIEGEVQGGVSLSDFFSRTGPANGSEYAKLLVWLFVSGFAEKFVPDVLDRIKKGETSNKEK